MSFAINLSSSTLGQGGATATGSVTLANTSAGSQAITSTAWGQTVTLPDATLCSLGAQLFNLRNLGEYVLKILNYAGTCIGFIRPQTAVDVGLADKSTSAGVWMLQGEELLGLTASNPIAVGGSPTSTTAYVELDTDRDFLMYQGTNNVVYGLIFNKTTGIWGSATVIRSAFCTFNAIKTATDQIMVVSCDGTTNFESVVLSISSTTITVNTPATATLPGSFNGGIYSLGSNKSLMVLVGSTVVVSYSTSAAAAPVIRAMTISGTTVTIGSATALPGNDLNRTCPIYAVSSSVLLAISQTDPVATLSATCYTISGTTITVGSTATTSITNLSFTSGIFGSAWALIYISTNVRGAVLTVSGTTPTLSTALLCTTTNVSPQSYIGSTKVTVAVDNASTSILVNTFSNSGGTISAGSVATTVIGTTSSVRLWPYSSTIVGMVAGVWVYSIDTSGVNPTITKTAQLPLSVLPQTGGYLVGPLTYKSNYYSYQNESSTKELSTYYIFSLTGMQRQGNGPATGVSSGTIYTSVSNFYTFCTHANNTGGAVIQRIEVAQ